jgi:hypothetical protein
MKWHMYDKAGKWLTQHQTLSVLHLAGVQNVISCRPRPPEMVQPGQLPDGLIEATLAGREQPVYYLIEFATKAERRLTRQLARDMMMVYLNFGVVPEVLAIILNQSGRYRAESSFDYRSPSGHCRVTGNWNVTELWRLPADQLLAMNDVGLIPWVPLTAFEQPAEVIVRECKERIDRFAPADQHGEFLIVTAVLTDLRFKDRRLLEILGGKNLVAASSPLKQIFDEFYEDKVVEVRQEDILEFLKARFKKIPVPITRAIKATKDSERLDALVKLCGTCASLREFESVLSS